MKRTLAVIAVSLACAVGLHAVPVYADDTDGALVDGGSIITSTDGGRSVTAELRTAGNWTLALRCEGAQSTRYRLCTTSSCTAAAGDQLLDYDVTQDIGVNRVLSSATKKYIGLRTDDAGIPYCLGHHSR